MTPDTIVTDIIRREGSRFTNDPADAGGPTKFGVTQRTLAAFRGRPVTADEVAALTEAEARQVYLKMFWTDVRLPLIADHSLPIAAEIMDTGVNCGPVLAVRLFQRLLNVFNDGGRLYPDILMDGQIGPRTASALGVFLRLRGREGERVMLVALNGMQTYYYVDLAERRPTDERFVYGWIRERVAAQL